MIKTRVVGLGRLVGWLAWVVSGCFWLVPVGLGWFSWFSWFGLVRVGSGLMGWPVRLPNIWPWLE